MFENSLKPHYRSQNIVVQEFDNEILIYDLKTDKAFCLNQSSLLIWRACDGRHTIGEISEKISRRLNTPVTDDFVRLALEQLRNNDLIEIEGETPTPFEEVSRREMIRKAGAASMIALPAISSLIAPTAVQAQSNCFGDNNANQSGLNCTCNSASDCRSNCCGTSTAGNVCVTPALEPTGSSCRAGCECASGSCPTGVNPRVCA